MMPDFPSPQQARKRSKIAGREPLRRGLVPCAVNTPASREPAILLTWTTNSVNNNIVADRTAPVARGQQTWIVHA
jgi:hypothetical protein